MNYYGRLSCFRLKKQLNPNGRLYFIGMNPIPDKPPAHTPAQAQIISEIRQSRDACILLASHRPYRCAIILLRSLHDRALKRHHALETTPSEWVLSPHSMCLPFLHLSMRAYVYVESFRCRG